MSTINGGQISNVNLQPNTELSGEAAGMASKAIADAIATENRAHHTRELEAKAAQLEKENEERRHEKAAEERLHRAEQEKQHLEHPAPFPFNLLHSQAEGDGPHIVAVADVEHGSATFDVAVSAHDADAHAVEATPHAADDHSAQDSHVVDHSHDAMTDPSAAA